MTKPKPEVLFMLGAVLAVLCLIDAGTTGSKSVRFSSSIGLLVAWAICILGLHWLGREGPE